MRTYLLSVVLAALSTSASANTLFDFSRPTTFTELKAELIPSETPDVVTVKVSGKVFNGASSCLASFNRARLRLVEDKETVTIEGRLTPVSGLALMCEGSFDSEWNGSSVAKVFTLTPEAFETAVVLGYPSKGESVSLSELVEGASSL